MACLRGGDTFPGESEGESGGKRLVDRFAARCRAEGFNFVFFSSPLPDIFFLPALALETKPNMGLIHKTSKGSKSGWTWRRSEPGRLDHPLAVPSPWGSLEGIFVGTAGLC